MEPIRETTEATEAIDELGPLGPSKVDHGVTGCLPATLDVTIDEARRGLQDAAPHAGATETALADVVMAMHRGDGQRGAGT